MARTTRSIGNKVCLINAMCVDLFFQCNDAIVNACNPRKMTTRAIASMGRCDSFIRKPLRTTSLIRSLTQYIWGHMKWSYLPIIPMRAPGRLLKRFSINYSLSSSNQENLIMLTFIGVANITEESYPSRVERNIMKWNPKSSQSSERRDYSERHRRSYSIWLLT